MKNEQKLIFTFFSQKSKKFKKSYKKKKKCQKSTIKYKISKKIDEKRLFFTFLHVFFNIFRLKYQNNSVREEKSDEKLIKFFFGFLLKKC